MLDTSVMPAALETPGETDRKPSSGLGDAIAGRRRLRREAATRKMAVQLRKAEDVLDQAGIELARTLIVSLEVRMEGGISATFGHDLVAAQAEGLVNWSRSRGHTVDWHSRALRYAGVLGTRTVAEGDTDRPDDKA